MWQATSRPEALNQTFGIEAEYHLYERSPSWMQKVAQSICISEYPALVYQESKLGFLTWQVELDWFINSYSIHDRQLEVKNRILSISDIDEMNRVVRDLNDYFQLSVDRTTALHVHHGNSFGEFPLHTLSNVILIQVAFEHLWNKLHPWDRTYHPCVLIQPSGIWNTYSSPHFQSRVLQSISAGIARVNAVLKASCLDDLIEITQDAATIGRYGCVNLNRLLPRGYDRAYQTRMIEFRQHQSTTDIMAIQSWVQLTGALVRYAHRVSDEDQVCYLKDAMTVALAS